MYIHILYNNNNNNMSMYKKCINKLFNVINYNKNTTKNHLII